MSLLAKRLICLAGATVKDPLAPDDTQLALVQGRIGIRLDPTVVLQGPAPLPSIADFYDVLVDESFDKSGFVVLYEAELYSDQSIIVKRDLFGEGDFPHNWAGWLIPGDPEKPPQIPPTLADLEVLAQAKQRRHEERAIKPTKGK